jgi:hypothetical protein
MLFDNKNAYKYIKSVKNRYNMVYDYKGSLSYELNSFIRGEKIII